MGENFNEIMIVGERIEPVKVFGKEKAMPARRCCTAFQQSHSKFCEACSIRLVRQMTEIQERQKLEEAVMVLGIQRSKSEVDIQSVMSDVSLPSGTLIRERSSVFMVHVPDSRAAMSRNRESVAPNREEIRVSKTVTPKKGLIKLTSLDYELKNQFVFENKTLLEKERNQRKHRPTPQKMLIRRKDIVDQIKAGNKQLMEHEKTKEVDGGMEKQIGEYTFADLQMNIDNMTNKNTRRGFKGKIDPKKQHQEMNKERMTGLPQLNSVKPFGS